MMAGIGVLTAIFYMFDMSDMEMRTSLYRITIHEPNLTSSYMYNNISLPLTNALYTYLVQSNAI